MMTSFQGAAFSPDGRKLAATGQINARTATGEAGPNDTDANGLVIVFDLETGAILWRRTGMTTGIIRDIAFSPDGKWLASARQVREKPGDVPERRCDLHRPVPPAALVLHFND